MATELQRERDKLQREKDELQREKDELQRERAARETVEIEALGMVDAKVRRSAWLEMELQKATENVAALDATTREKIMGLSQDATQEDLSQKSARCTLYCAKSLSSLLLRIYPTP